MGKGESKSPWGNGGEEELRFLYDGKIYTRTRNHAAK